MYDPTPEQQKRIDAALSRAEAIRDEINELIASNRPFWECAERILMLNQEMWNLSPPLEENGLIAPATAQAPLDTNHARQVIDFLRKQCAIATSDNEWIKFVEGMAAKHGTVLPDFNTFYQWRSDLERRIAAREVEQE